MQRNTMILVILLGIFATIVVAANIARQSDPPTPETAVQPTVIPTPAPLSDSTCGITFSYPDYLTKVDIETGGVTLVNTKKEGDAIVVVCQEEIPRVPLSEDKIETIRIGSVSASLYHDASQKDGTPIDKLIFTHPILKKTDVYVAGYGEVFNTFIQTIQIDSNK